MALAAPDADTFMLRLRFTALAARDWRQACQALAAAFAPLQQHAACMHTVWLHGGKATSPIFLCDEQQDELRQTVLDGWAAMGQAGADGAAAAQGQASAIRVRML